MYYYCLTTLFAVTNGCIISIAFSSLLAKNIEEDDDGGVDIELLCPKSYGKLSVLPSGTIQCVPNDSNITRYERFSLIDTEDILINDAMVQRTFLDQILSTFDSLVPNNVIQSFAVANIISIIVIGLVFGVAMTHIMSTHEEYRNTVPVVKSNDGSQRSNGDTRNHMDDSNNEHRNSPRIFTPGAVFDFCREMSLICNLIIRWIVKLAPYCIAFLIAGSLSQAGRIFGIVIISSGNLIYLLKSVGIYCISAFFGMCIHLTISLPFLFYYYTGENPYHWIFSCRRALLVALSTASSV